MNDDTPRHERGHRDDRDIRLLMRESDYPGKAREDFKRNLLREINHNFTYHRTRTRLLVTAVVVLGSLAAVMKVTDVGSDGWSLSETGRVVDGGAVLEAPFTGERIGVATGLTGEAGRAEAERIYAEIVAGEMILREVVAWTFEGETTFILVQQRPGAAPGELNPSITGSPENAARIARFLQGAGRSHLDSIAAGTSEAEATDLVSYAGIPLPMARWTWEVPGFGTVVYRKFVAPPGFELTPEGR